MKGSPDPCTRKPWRRGAYLGSMKQLATTAVLLVFLAGSALAGSYRVTYSLRGSGKRITVQAESTAEARRVVKDLFPQAVVTGAHKVRGSEK